MTVDVEKLNEVELIDLHHRIVDRLNFLEQVRSRERMLEFSIGDRVSFTPTDRPIVFGVLTKYNKKTVSIVTDCGHRWNVAPSLLELAPSSEQSSVPGENIVPLFKKQGGA